MKNKPFRTILKIWITAGSLGAFFFGWTVLGHSGKPVAVSGADTSTSADSQVAPLPTLAPLPPIGRQQNLQPLAQQQQPSFSFAQPRFRTRGS